MAFKDSEKGKAYYKAWHASEHGQKWKKEYAKNYYLTNITPEKKRAAHMKQRFGITMEEYARLMAAQNYVCGICYQKQVAELPLAVDHCHKTGKVRGLLCNTCNSAIGMLKDDIELLKNSITWIQKHEN